MTVAASDPVSGAILVQHKHHARGKPALRHNIQQSFKMSHADWPERSRGHEASTPDWRIAASWRVMRGQMWWGLLQWTPPCHASSHCPPGRARSWSPRCSCLCWRAGRACGPGLWLCRRPSPRRGNPEVRGLQQEVSLVWPCSTCSSSVANKTLSPSFTVLKKNFPPSRSRKEKSQTDDYGNVHVGHVLAECSLYSVNFEKTKPLLMPAVVNLD